MRPASGCRESWLPDVGQGAASPYALAWWFQMAMDRRWFYSLSFVCRARGSPGTLQRDAPADLQRPVAAHTRSLDPGGSPEHPPSQEGEGVIAPPRHAHTRLLGDGRGRVPSDTEATSHTPRPLPGRGRGAGGVPVCPAHPLPLPLTLQLLTADHSLSLRKDIQTFHFPFCLVLGPVQTKGTRSQSQGPASAPDGYPAPPPHSPTPRHPGTHGFITSHWAFPGLAKHPANHTDTGSRPAMGAEVEMV